LQMDELADLRAAAGLSDHFGFWHQSAEKSQAQIGTRAVATYLSSNGKDKSSRPECAPALPAALKQQLSLESEGMALAQTDNGKSHDRPRPKSGLLEELRRALEEVRFPVLSAAHYCVCSKASHLCCALWHTQHWVGALVIARSACCRNVPSVEPGSSRSRSRRDAQALLRMVAGRSCRNTSTGLRVHRCVHRGCPRLGGMSCGTRHCEAHRAWCGG
jgi:hypothetical protein